LGRAPVGRGWMEVLAVGETRSGKSTAAQRLLNLYGRGHYQSTENASVAGLLFGIEKRQSMSSDRWSGSIGVLPLNNRGLVVLDEAQGLTTEQISQMSDMRSRGVVQISKIRSSTVPARVRLIWMANGRKSRYPRRMRIWLA
jgi:DNA replicative helicase MCM subunit Mcm2 (Cdc46/Mcm family)